MASIRPAIFAVICVLLVTAALWIFYSPDPPELESSNLSISEDILQLDNQNFALVRGPREFNFPNDHGPHLEFRSEWWYFTGNVVTSNGEHYGYQFTIFRQANGESKRKTHSDWESNHIYMAHMALTDAANNKFYSDEIFARGAAGLAQVVASPFSAHVDHWSATGRLINDCTGCMALNLRAEGDGFAIDLDLKSIKPVVYQGDRGFSQKGNTPGNASHYYSLTRMETKGNISVRGTIEAVNGLSWMDHEWSTSALDDQLVGWDWVSLQFDDGRELMYYQLRTEDGKAFETSEGTLVDEIGGTERLIKENVEFNSTRTWTNPSTNVSYPVAWTLKIPDKNLSLMIEPMIDAQEHDNIFRYWEGAVNVVGMEGTKRIAGSGYLELVGYE